MTRASIIIGANAVGHDSSIAYYNSDTGDIFALENERVTRLKHDGTTIKDCILEFLSLNTNNASARILDIAESYSNEECFTMNYLIEKKIILEVKRIFKLSYIKEISAMLELPLRKRIKKYLDKFPYSWRLIYFDLIRYFLEHIYFIGRCDFNIRRTSTNRRLKSYIINDLKKIGFPAIDVKLYDHHLCHCISAYYFSPFNRCLSMSLDYSGDGYFSKIYHCEDGRIHEVAVSPVIRQNQDYVSIGKVYSMLTHYLGFIPNSDEGKVEALAAYGSKENVLYWELMGNTFIKDDLGIGMNTDILRVIQTDYLDSVSKQCGREGIAAAVQGFLEDFMVEYLKKIIYTVGIYDVCFSGGTFANVKLNMALFEKSDIRNQYIFPAMPDSGAAMGALILRLNEFGLISFDTFKKKHYQMPYWGVKINQKEIDAAINKFSNIIDATDFGVQWPEIIAAMVCDGKIGGIFHGRSEYGPRALGNRSILADARRPESRERINKIIKGRPWFQPFCPSILEEDRLDLFKYSYPNKHMTCAFKMRDCYVTQFPSGVHIDGTGRPQFVEEEDNPDFYRLLKKVKLIIGKGILINTSFNKHGRTMVLKPEHAIIDFIDSQMDFLCLEGKLITRKP